VNPQLFREILDLAIERYETDRASYHVSASLANVQDPRTLSNPQLSTLLDQFDARQVFHVTFGAALDRFGAQIMETLRGNENSYDQVLTAHFKKHLEPLL